MSIYGTTKQLRLRELFNSVLNHPQLPSDYVKVFYLLFIRYESKYGTPRRLLQIIHTACQKVPQGEKCAFYKLYIVKIVQNYGLLHTRDVFQESLGQVAGGIGAKTPSQPNQTKFSSSKHHEKELYEIGRTFIRLELKLNQTNRARAIYQYIAKAINPTGNYGQIWDEFKEFEASFGDVTSFKAFGALKRQTIQYYKETALYRRALAAQEKQFELAEKEKKELEMKRLLAQKE
jgi:pre-mRNA-splicing factor SYF1